MRANPLVELYRKALSHYSERLEKLTGNSDEVVKNDLLEMKKFVDTTSDNLGRILNHDPLLDDEMRHRQIICDALNCYENDKEKIINPIKENLGFDIKLVRVEEEMKLIKKGLEAFGGTRQRKETLREIIERIDKNLGTTK